MDYRHLKQILMKTFQQLVIFELTETGPPCAIQENATVIDLSNGSPNKRYFAGQYNYKQLLITLEKLGPNGSEQIGSEQDLYQNYLSTIYNLYGGIVKGFKQTVSFEEMERRASLLENSDKQVHWIWFREKGFCLPNKIMSRAKSWVELNSDFKFYLWTNIANQTELDDFLSQLTEENKKYFTDGRIIVKLHEQIIDIVNRYCDNNTNNTCANSNTLSKTNIIKYLFGSTQPIVNTVTSTDISQTQTVTTVVTTTQTPHNFKINRIFRTDMLRIILLNTLGGIYSDFNDTICFYPMKYLLTMYRGSFFIGTDYDIDHPIYRNNYFIYNSLGCEKFKELSIRCLNKACHEYERISSTGYMSKYYNVCLEFLSKLTTPVVNGEICLIPILIQIEQIKTLIAEDQHKDVHRVINMVIEIFDYFGKEIESFKSLSQRLTHEMDVLDPNWIKMYKIKEKMRLRRKKMSISDQVQVPFVYDIEVLNKMVSTYDYKDHFLIKYAINMTIGDLILSTNIAYIDEIENLIPYSRSNRLSTISMLTHIYDGTSYGLNKNYDSTGKLETPTELRQEFL